MSIALPRVSVHKYRACKTTVDGITFDSGAEARRYGELLLMKHGGAIRELTRQPRFELQAGFRDRHNTWQRAIYYIADFQYEEVETGLTVVEDVKGIATAVFKLKKKLFLNHIQGHQ